MVRLASYETYKALPAPKQPYSPQDLALLREVVQQAYEVAFLEGRVSPSFRHILSQYEFVLKAVQRFTKTALQPDPTKVPHFSTRI